MMQIVGAKNPLVILSYHNYEIYCFHLDGYKKDTKALLNRLNEIELLLTSKPLTSKFRIWYNIDENKLDNSTMKLIVESISRYQNHIYKIAFIGLYGINKFKFNYFLKNALEKNIVCKAYFTDAELAKGWLV